MKSILTILPVVFFYLSNSQDLIILKTGDELRGKVIKVGTSEVEFKKDTSGPVYAIKKSEVFMIKYESGAKDVLANIGVTEVKKGESDILKSKYLSGKRASIALFVFAGSCMVAGSVLTSTHNIVYRSARNGAIAGMTLLGSSIPLLIGGGICIKKYVKYKRQWKEQQRSLSFNTTGIRVNF